MRLFPDLKAFYDAVGGARSGESDFGAWWTDNGVRWPAYRVSVVKDTGDVYAIRLGGYPNEGRVELLGTLTDDIGESDVYERAERVFAGWTECIHQADSLVWVRERMAEAACTSV